MMRIIEVGPRDGLQNEATPISTEMKLRFIQKLVAAGLHTVEVTSFVSPKWVPQLGDAAELWPLLPEYPHPSSPELTGPLQGGEGNYEFSALVPNLRGLERAVECGVDRIALFTAASDAFTQKNINMTVEESLTVFADVAAAFRAANPKGWIRGYVSTAFECPYAGKIDPEQTVKIAKRLMDIGVNEVSIGDTIGAASPKEVHALNEQLFDEIPSHKTAYHFHDTRGTAIANVAAAIDWGVVAFDSSAGGLGGCPYAPGAGGNLATEDLVYFLTREGHPTGVNLEALSQASLEILQALGRSPSAKAQVAVLAESCRK